jgi:hypothetical protein
MEEASRVLFQNFLQAMKETQNGYHEREATMIAAMDQYAEPSANSMVANTAGKHRCSEITATQLNSKGF